MASDLNSKLARIRPIVGSHLDDILSLFAIGAKITVLVRQPDHPDGTRDFVMTDEPNLEDAIKALNQRTDAPGNKSIFVPKDLTR